MRRNALGLLWLTFLCTPLLADDTPIPPALEGWQAWVLDGRGYLACPVVDGTNAAQPEGHVCLWPGPLDIEAARGGAKFNVRVRVHAPGWVPLPGDADHWPQDVRTGGSSVPVLSRNGLPHVRLEAGEHLVTGQIVWSAMPDSLSVPSIVGIVRLSVDGRRVELAERTGNVLRLGAARSVTAANRLDVQVFRKLTDDIPGLVATRIILQVSGEPREIVIGPLLPESVEPLQLSTPLPARLDPDGRLRLQVRPGSWALELTGRTSSSLDELALPVGSPAEIWSFEAVDRLRSTAVEGVAAVDPSQVNVPADWQSLPAYRIGPKDVMRIVERSRGVSGQDLDRLEIRRDLWWDFDGDGYTFRDQISGQLQTDWRLDMEAPYVLQGVRSGGQPLLVTSGAGNSTGVEIRTPQLDLEATGRIGDSTRRLAATGWNRHVASLSIALHLPPGHRLLAAFGADEAPLAWLQRWRLLDLFAVLLVSVIAFRIAGLKVAVLSLLGLVLAHHELPALTWATLNLLVAIAFARAAPAGRLQRWASWWRAVGFVAVAVVFVPFALQQARLAFFPQLDSATSIVFGPVQAQMAEDASFGPDVSIGPEMKREASVAAGRAATAAEEIAVTANRSADMPVPASPPYMPAENLTRYPYDARLQNGPGVPRWDYLTYGLQWSGPVEPTQSLHLVVLSQGWVSLWRIAAIVLLAALYAGFARTAYEWAKPFGPDRWWPGRRAESATVGSLLAIALMAMLTTSPRASAADTPSAELLEELGRRLSRTPDCSPVCVSVADARVRLDGAQLTVRLEAHAAARAVLPLPHAMQRWAVDDVTVDGSAARGQAQVSDGTLIVPLEAGVHVVELAGRIVATDAIRLTFPSRPSRVVVDAAGWELSGVEQDRLLGDGLSLIRTRSQDDERTGKPLDEAFPPYVRVIRTLYLDLDWRAQVEVQRLAPAQGAFVVELPLLPGESVLTPGIPVKDQRVVVSLPAGAQSTVWESNVAHTERLTLVAPAQVPWVEVWRVIAGPVWHLKYSGTPEVYSGAGAGQVSVQEFEPRPGESLEIGITRPEGVAGETFAFERVAHQLNIGRRSTDTTLELAYRSTQGGRHVVQLPEHARLQSVLADGQPIVLDVRNAEISLPLQPGEHTLALAWQIDDGASLASKPAGVDLRAPSSNVSTRVALPQNRWVLYANGGGVGPAVLYWAELLVFVVLAVAIGRFSRSPLPTRDWLLVGLGLSTFSWSVLLLFAAWVFALEWRRRWRGAVEPWLFNGVQVVLALLTIVALGSLLSAIPHGLLGQPDMRIEDPLYDPSSLNWFHDRVASALPQPLAISVSLWFYKAAMLAWALWLSFALVRWVRWAWQSYSAGEYWRRVVHSAARPAPDAASIADRPPAS